MVTRIIDVWFWAFCCTIWIFTPHTLFGWAMHNGIDNNEGKCLNWYEREVREIWMFIFQWKIIMLHVSTLYCTFFSHFSAQTNISSIFLWISQYCHTVWIIKINKVEINFNDDQNKTKTQDIATLFLLLEHFSTLLWWRSLCSAI